MCTLKYIILTISIISIILIPLFLINTYDTKSKIVESELQNDFPRLQDLDMEVKGIVMSKESNINIRGGRIFSLTNGLKFTLGGTPHNYLYIEPDLINFVSVKDSIFKPMHTDSVFIYKDGKQYYFVLGKILNTEYKK